MQDHNNFIGKGYTFYRAKSSLHLALLGCVALVAIGGTFVDAKLIPTGASAAISQSGGVTSFADVVDHVKGAVVSVKVNTVEVSDDEGSMSSDVPDLQPGSPAERFFKKFGEQNGQPKPRAGQSLGSGFLISADGYIVTNNHVVEHGKSVSITTDDGKAYDAQVVGVDAKTDLALLKVKSDTNFPFVNFSGKSPRVGDWVIAVGNPFGLGGTVTAGIVSARGRDIGSGPYDDFLQIDAPVNRGNSGGPTFNVDGDVVGVNTAIYSPSGGSVGIGFAIPSETVKSVVASLKDNGAVARSWIGVQIQPVSADIADSLSLKSTKGALIAEPQKGSPAAEAGLKSGDVITAVNGDLIEGPRELARKISGLSPDHTVDVTIQRDGREKTLPVKLAAMPGEPKEAGLTSAEQSRTSLAALGLTLAPASSMQGSGKSGVVVAAIDQSGIAAQKGLRAGDIILEVAGQSVSRPSEIVAAFDAAKRDGKKAVLLRLKSADGSRFVALATQANS